MRRNDNRPFAGKVIILAGDFRQILPVVVRGARAQIVGRCIRWSPLWRHFRPFRLSKNMRVRMAATGGHATVCDKVTVQTSTSSHPLKVPFAEYLMHVGNGHILDILTFDATEDGFWKDAIALPLELCLEAGSTIQHLIDWTFPDFLQNYLDPSWISRRSILCAKHENVDAFTEIMCQLMPGDTTTCFSADPVEGDDDIDSIVGANGISVEYLNSLRVGGLPPHRPDLKPDMPVVPMRNLKGALCNGTRLIVSEVGALVLRALNPLTGDQVLIPRMKLKPMGNEKMPFE